MWETLLRYYGVDWLAMGLSLASIHLLGDKRRAGFALGMAGAVLWFAFGVWVSSIASALLNALLFGLFARGWPKWGNRRAGAPGRPG